MNRLDKWARITAVATAVAAVAAVVAAVATVVAVTWGVITYFESAQAQAEAEAVGLVREHWTLADDHPLWASELPEHKENRVDADGTFDRSYARFASHALLTAEAAYKLAGGKPGRFERWFTSGEVESKQAWNSTILDLASTHDTFVLSFDFPCEQYDQQFIEFLKEGSDRYSTICPAKTEEDQDAIENLSRAADAQKHYYHNEGNKKRYAKDIRDLIDRRGFEQGDPPVVIEKGSTRNESYYCMDAKGKAYEYFRMTPYEDKPIPGSCGRW